MSTITDHLVESERAMSLMAGSRRLAAELERIAATMVDTINGGGKILLVGNGGSAADCQHIAAEFIGRFRDMHPDRMPLPALALTTDTSALTCIGNDYNFARIFRRQVDALGKPGDVLWALSTSGNSPNVIEAALAARALNMRVIGFTGERPSKLGAASSQCIRVPSDDTAIVQQLHMVCAHAICGTVESMLSGYWTK
jgi:D-sedoheptulose 7-phosphate isomerase